MSDAPASAGAPSQGSKRAGIGWWRLLVNLYKEMNEDHIGLIAAGVAFYALLAIFPAMVVLMALAGLILDPATVQAQIDGLAQVIPPEAAQIVIDQAVAVTGSTEGGLGLAALFGLVVALYSASKGVQSLVEGLNVAFEVQETRGIVRLYATIFGLTLALILGFILVAVLLAVVPALLALFPLGGLADVALQVLRWPLLVGVVVVALALLYRYAPSRGPVPWHWITLGAAAATGLWLLGSILFSIYVANFGAYNETFGTLGGVLVLLTWLWLSAFIVLMGAELDAEVERQDKEAGDASAPVETAKAVTPGASPGPAPADSAPATR